MCTYAQSMFPCRGVSLGLFVSCRRAVYARVLAGRIGVLWVWRLAVEVWER